MFGETSDVMRAEINLSVQLWNTAGSNRFARHAEAVYRAGLALLQDKQQNIIGAC